MKKIIQPKGIYQPGRGTNYSGYFYDALKDEATVLAQTRELSDGYPLLKS